MMQLRKWSLIEVPDHLGVLHVGGRAGACHGPRAFHRIFERMSGRFDVRGAMERRVSVPGIGADIFQNHRQTADVIRDAQLSSGLTVVVGGGHDHGYSQLWGVREALGPETRLGCINIDAHLDLRQPSPLPGSGSPFYLAIENGVIDPVHLIEFGIQSHCNGPTLWKYAEEKKIQVHPWSELRGANRVEAFRKALTELSARVDAVVISLDLDSLSQDHCPGVSAPQAEGFTTSEVIAMMEIAGRSKAVVSLGIFELNPEHDVQDATARVAATSAHHFIEAALSS